MNIVWGVEECKSGTEIRGKYWAGTTIYYVYRTEKITDNWWFFEYKQWDTNNLDSEGKSEK